MKCCSVCRFSFSRYATVFFDSKDNVYCEACYTKKGLGD